MTCRMCIRAVRTFAGPEMEFDLFKKIIDEVKGRLSYISLDGPGETIMNPDAFRMIGHARSQGIRVMFSTNATLLDEARRADVLNSGADMIIFSINATTPEVYEEVHGVHKRIHPGPKRRAPCPRLWYGPAFVETNGDVYASPGVLYKAGPVGNLTKSTLTQIWNNGAMQSMRAAHARGDAALFTECRDCAYLQPRLPLVIAGFMIDPFRAGKLLPLAERLAFWQRLPLFERHTSRPSSLSGGQG
jgi:radical SAM protein with 4Fe4S-binding SPASM domain